MPVLSAHTDASAPAHDLIKIDIGHVVPLAHAHRYGANTWTKAQRRKFANDFENLLVVDDSTNQSKSDQVPHEWLPPLKNY